MASRHRTRRSSVGDLLCKTMGSCATTAVAAWPWSPVWSRWWPVSLPLPRVRWARRYAPPREGWHSMRHVARLVSGRAVVMSVLLLVAFWVAHHRVVIPADAEPVVGYPPVRCEGEAVQ